MVRGASVVALLLLGCDGGTDPSPTVPPEFGPAELVPSPVSTSGWEDSGYITPDVIGPARPGWPTTAPYDTFGAEIYRTLLHGGVWSEPENLGLPINRPEDLEGDEWVSADGNRILFTNGASTPTRPERGIYYAECHGGVWDSPVLARDAGFPFVAFDENPHLTQDERTLFFESSRPGGNGRQDIWMSQKVGNQWSAPRNLGPSINTDGVEGSPFSLDGTDLFFDDKGNGIGISWSHREADGLWSQRKVVVAGIYGDPSLTVRGDLYAIGARSVGGGFDANVYRFARIR